MSSNVFDSHLKRDTLRDEDVGEDVDEDVGEDVDEDVGEDVGEEGVKLNIELSDIYKMQTKFLLW